MTTKPYLIFAAAMITLLLSERAPADEAKNLMVRLAKLEIHAAHLESYKVALKEEIEASIRLEPGVIALWAVSEKKHPTRITLMETYASVDACRSNSSRSIRFCSVRKKSEKAPRRRCRIADTATRSHA